jgi:hypothetical protein
MSVIQSRVWEEAELGVEGLLHRDDLEEGRVVDAEHGCIVDFGWEVSSLTSRNGNVEG